MIMVKMEQLNVRKSILGVVSFLGVLSLSGCGDPGYGSTIETCRPGDDTGVIATPGTRDMNDPFVLLASNNGKFVNDGRSQPNPILDWLDDGHGFGGQPGPRKSNNDYVDSMGELVCTPDESDTKMPEKYDLVFTPAGLKIQNYYLVPDEQI